MNYSEFIQKSKSNRIVIAEFDLGLNQTMWISHQAGIWKAMWGNNKTTIGIGDGTIGSSPIGQPEYKNYLSIGSVFVAGTEYTEKSSLSDVIANEKSWYYDEESMILYIHNENSYEPQIVGSIVVGLTLGLSNKAKYYNDLYYEPRLISAPDFSKTKDPLFFGIIRFDGGSIELNNKDGFFDGVTSYYLFGQPAAIKYGDESMDYDELQTVFTGYIENVEMNYDTVTFELVDDRKKLSQKLPPNTFSTDDYSELDEDDIGKPIPLIYGEVYHMKPICINKAQSGSDDWEFIVCDVSDHSYGIEDIVDVYVDGDSVSFTADETNGKFTIDYSDWEGKKEVTADVKGLKNSSGTYITNPMDIIKDILVTYSGITYDEDHFNTTEWETAKAHDLANDIGLLINEQTEISSVIESICNSMMGNFIVLSDGRYTMRMYDPDEDPLLTIYQQEQTEKPDVSYSGTEFIAKCSIGYKKNWAAGEYRWYIEDHSEAEIYSKYKKKPSKEFETLLTNEEDAQKLAEAIMDYYGQIKAVYTVTTGINADLVEIESNINIEVNRIGKEWLDFVKVETIGVTKDLINGTIVVTGRHVTDDIGIVYRSSPYAINVDKYAINIDYYALTYDTGRYNYGT